MTSRVLVGDIDPLVARGLIQTLIDERFDVVDATSASGIAELAEVVGRLHPDAVILRMAPRPEEAIRALRAREPHLRVVECDDDRPQLRVHPADGLEYLLEPVTASTLRAALGDPEAYHRQGVGQRGRRDVH